jgi:hypothetical protein
MTLHHTFVKDPKGKNIGVFLPLGDYNKIVQILEDYEDIIAFDKAIKHKNETISFREALKLQSGKK